MSLLSEIVESFSPLLAGGAVGRFEEIQDRFSSPLHIGWLWVGIAVLSVAAIGTLVGLLVLHRRAILRRSWQAFGQRARQCGLSGEEQTLLARIARKAGLAEPIAIFTSEASFRQGIAAMAASDDPLHLGNGICTGCAFLILLTEKLGFQAPAGETKAVDIQLGPLAEGTVLTVVRPVGVETFQAVVTAVKGSEELTIAPESPVDCRPGESWVLRLAEGGTVWEFNALLLKVGADGVVVRPFGEARWINRRRFVRVPTRKPAFVVPFPFRRSGQQYDTPEFIPAALIEIGGPGVQLVAPAEAEAGQRVLVVLELGADQLVESVGIVHRVVPCEHGVQMSVELVGLNTAEINELAKATNAAAQASRPSAAAPEMAAAAQES